MGRGRNTSTLGLEKEAPAALGGMLMWRPALSRVGGFGSGGEAKPLPNQPGTS